MTSMTPERIIRRLLRVRSWRGLLAVLIAFGLLWLQQTQEATPPAPEGAIACSSPRVLDGDTFACGKLHIRLQGIDAPEMPGHCRPGRECTPGDPYKARNALIGLTRGEVTCKQTDIDTYGRTVARCWSGGVDLSCEMIAQGLAVRRYGAIKCQ